ncbi:MAG: sugar phosphate isomerase/epimerase family protein [Kiritimatiellia bacterium]
MQRPISVQLYSLRERTATDLAGVLKDLAAFGYKGVEPAGLAGKTAREVRQMVDDLGLVVSSAHIGVPTKDNLSEIVDMAKTLGCAYVISGLGGDGFKTVDSIKQSAALFQAAAELLKPHGLQLGYHNHWWEFDLVEGRYGYSRFLELCPAVFSELDVYWANNFNRVDVSMVVRAHKKQIQLLHIKDGPLVQGQPHTAVGQGRMNIPAVVQAAGKDTTWLVVELDECATDMTQAVRESLNYLKKSRMVVCRT